MIAKTTERLGLTIALLAAFQFQTLPLTLRQNQQAAQSSPQQDLAATAVPQGTYRIAGVVLDARSGLPLGDAVVQAGMNTTLSGDIPAGQRGDPQTVLTGPDGRYSFDGLQPGQYSLFARKRGYEGMYYLQHENYYSAVVVGPGLDPGDVVFELHRNAVISGQVIDEANEPVGDAQVMVFRRNLTEGATAVALSSLEYTDDQGRYRFSSLQAGTYFVAVNAHPWYAVNFRPNLVPVHIVSSDGTEVTVRAQTNDSLPEPSSLDVVYPLTYYPGVPDSGQASPLAVSAGEEASANFQLFPVPSVFLRIKLPPEADPESFISAIGSQATLGGRSIQLMGQISFTVEDGSIVVTGFPAGHFQLTMIQNSNSTDNKPQPAQWTEDVDTSQGPEITLGKGMANGGISGTAKVYGGGALPSSCAIQIRNRETRQAFGAVIVANGTFDVRPPQGIPAGTYDVFAANCGSNAVDRVTSSDVKTAGRSFEMTSAGSPKLAVQLRSDLARVECVVLRDGKPDAGAMVLMVPSTGLGNPRLIERDESNTDGSVSFRGILPDTYKFVALDNGWNLEWANPDVLKQLLTKGETFQVTSNGVHKLTLNAQ